MKLYKDGIVRDVDENRASLMKKKGWMELGIDGKPVANTQDSEAKIAELEKALKDSEAKVAKLESLQTELPSNIMDSLSAYAKAKNVEFGSASSPQGILTKILESEKV